MRSAGRPCKKEHGTALNKAMELFWDKGYEGAAVSDLVEKTGLQPGSLYGSFKNKENLFLESIRLYGERAVAEAKKALHSGSSPESGIESFFDDIVKGQSSGSQKRGCFLVKTVIENSSTNSRLHKLACHYLDVIEDEIYLCLKKVKSFSPAQAKQIAKILICNVWGLRVLQASGAPVESVRAVARQMLTSAWATRSSESC